VIRSFSSLSYVGFFQSEQPKLASSNPVSEVVVALMLAGHSFPYAA